MTSLFHIRILVKTYSNIVNFFKQWNFYRKSICILFLLISHTAFAKEKPFVIADLYGQLGNQCFQIATATALALDNNAQTYFPDLIHNKDYGIPDNYRLVFSSLKTTPPRPIKNNYYEPRFTHNSIPFHSDMHIRGYFQSWKYFDHHREKIQKLFAPSKEILDYLHSKYADVVQDANSVAVHVRTYNRDDPERKIFVLNGPEYVHKAMSLFPKGSNFYLFSDDISWCKEYLTSTSYNIRFMENDHYIHDFYLQTLCRHNIISNSSFSWWAAYLNHNPNKKVLCPLHWFQPSQKKRLNPKDMIPPEWKIIKTKQPML